MSLSIAGGIHLDDAFSCSPSMQKCMGLQDKLKLTLQTLVVDLR